MTARYAVTIEGYDDEDPGHRVVLVCDLEEALARCRSAIVPVIESVLEDVRGDPGRPDDMRREIEECLASVRVAASAESMSVVLRCWEELSDWSGTQVWVDAVHEQPRGETVGCRAPGCDREVSDMCEEHTRGGW